MRIDTKQQPSMRRELENNIEAKDLEIIISTNISHMQESSPTSLGTKGDKMKVFISWSGELSKKIAIIFREWLPLVIQSVEPFVSSEDIPRGGRSFSKLAEVLEDTHFGLLCITKQNMNRPWILYEAGAISKQVNDAHVIPFLFNVTPSDLEGPLKQFQCVEFSENDIKKLVWEINQACGEWGRTYEQLNNAFEVLYPWLKERLEELRHNPGKWNDEDSTGNKENSEQKVLLTSRKTQERENPISNRLHMDDGLYKQIRSIHILNFASNLFVNEEKADPGHRVKGFSFKEAIKRILEESEATLDLILSEPTQANLHDMETKIANKVKGSTKGTLYSAWDAVYKMVTQGTNDSNIYKKLYKTRFQSYAINIGIPFAIFHVKFLPEYENLSHVKIDLYSAKIENEDERRSFVIWKEDDPENYKFFADNFTHMIDLCEKPSIEQLKKWSEEWEKIKGKESDENQSAALNSSEKKE